LEPRAHFFLQILKLHAWEPSFEQQVLEIRADELKMLQRISYMNACTNFIWLCAPFFVAVASFTAYVLSDSSHILTPTTAFVSLSLFNIMRVPMQQVPNVVTTMVQVRKSLRFADQQND
jgi:ATP-binding cassette subfamily C (CFTR/MRP) protein 1